MIVDGEAESLPRVKISQPPATVVCTRPHKVSLTSLILR
jgi:hypothetical protein